MLDPIVVGITDLFWAYAMVSIDSVNVENTCRSPTDQDVQRPHEFLACSDAYRQRWYGCSRPAGSGGGRLATTKQERTEHTLKMMRILLSSDFQAAMVSLSFLAWKSREAALRLLCLMTLFCISTTVLGSRA